MFKEIEKNHIIKTKTLIVSIFLIFQTGISQYDAPFDVPDSLKSKSLEYLENSYQKFFIPNKKKSKIYALSFLNIAKENKDTLKIAKGYDNLYEFYRFSPVSLEISEKIINLTQNFNLSCKRIL